MQLRSCNHLHFIQAVRDGQVTKVINVSHGKPALVFRKLNEIYGSQDAERKDPPSRLCSRKKVYASQFDPDKVKVEVPNHPTSTDQQFPASQFAPNKVNEINKHGDDLDELIFGNLTLNQIKERCRMKKRKWSASVTVDGKKGAGSDEKECRSISQLAKDDNDLEEPLIKLKLKLKKNVQGGKRKCKKKHATAASENAIIVVKNEQNWFEHSSLQSDWDLPMPLAIKVEVPEEDHEGLETAIFIPDDSSITDNEQLASYFLCAREEIQHVDECVSRIEVSSPESPVKDDQLKSTSDEADSMADPLEIRNYTRDLQSEPMEEEHLLNGGSCSDADDRSLLSDGDHIPIHYSSLQHVELAGAKLSFNFETSSTSRPINDSTLHCHENPSLSSTVSSLSSADDSSANKEELSQVSAHADVPDIQKIPSSDAVPEQTSSERVENNESPNLQHVSRRLFSTRQVISPSSQEWLCKAIRSDELSDEELHKCRGKVCFRKQRNDKTSLVERMDQIRVGDLIGKVKKQKNDRTGSPHEGIQKMRQLSSATASHISVECNSMRSSSENAIAFSQRQMQDIENLVAKLMVELKSVKEIAEEASCSGVCLSTQSKYGPDEVKARIESAIRVEDTAKRWLSMMARDCSRFCKIMRLTENSRPVSESTGPKERKISFADEAGRKLCNVKYI